MWETSVPCIDRTILKDFAFYPQKCTFEQQVLTTEIKKALLQNTLHIRRFGWSDVHARTSRGMFYERRNRWNYYSIRRQHKVAHTAKASVRAAHSYARELTDYFPDSKLREFTAFMPCVLNGIGARQWKKNFLRRHKDWLAAGRSVRLLCGTEVKARTEQRRVIFVGSPRGFSVKFAETKRKSVRRRRTKSAECSRGRDIMHISRGIQRNAWCLVRPVDEGRDASLAYWTTFTQQHSQRANGKMLLHVLHGEILMVILTMICHLSIPSSSHGLRQKVVKAPVNFTVSTDSVKPSNWHVTNFGLTR